VVQSGLVHIIRSTGWLYLLVVFITLSFLLYLAFGRLGSLRIGGEDEEPEFSAGSWFAMLFAAGMGIGLVFWGVGEPVSHYVTAPPGIASGTPEAANAAMRYVFFHWGLHPWAVYGVVALAIAFFQYRRQGDALISTVTGALPWRAVRSLSGLFNGLAVVATAFGVAASLGMGAMQINSGLQAVFGVAVDKTWQVGIIVVTTAIFVASAVSGVEKGVKLLSNFNMMLAALLALAVFLLGPTVAIIDTFSNTLGNYLNDIVRMSLRHAFPRRQLGRQLDHLLLGMVDPGRRSWGCSSRASRAGARSANSSSARCWRRRWQPSCGSRSSAAAR
jgi:glycine betaine transporter